MQTAIHSAEAPVYYELALDEQIWSQRNKLRENRNMRGVHKFAKFERQANGEVFEWIPGGPTVKVPEHIAKILLGNSTTFPLKRNVKGDQIMEEDKNGGRISILRVVKKWSADSIPEPSEPVKVLSFKCPYTGREFSDEEAFKVHLDGILQKKGVEVESLPEGSDKLPASAQSAAKRGPKGS